MDGFISGYTALLKSENPTALALVCYLKGYLSVDNWIDTLSDADYIRFMDIVDTTFALIEKGIAERRGKAESA